MTIPGTDDVDESMLVVPMVHEDALVGVITLSKLGLRQFDDDDLRLLSILGDLAATAFAGASHVAETRHLAAELRQLLDMSSALSRSLNPVDVANLMAEHLARAAGADQAQISDWDRGDGRVRTLGSLPARAARDARRLLPARRVPGDAARPRGGRHLGHRHRGPRPRTRPRSRSCARSGCAACVMLPLVAKGEAIGLVELASQGRPLSDASQITIVRTMAHEAAMALENARLYETARNLADRDPLTGFFNHRYLHERLSEEVVRAVRTRRPLSVVMLDLDDFKVVNDTFGHVYGDGVLVHVAELIRGTLRASDVAARYGGDEFALILPETGREDAAGVAERILAAFQGSPFVAHGRQPFAIGGSMGVATHPRDGYSATTLIAAADVALYDAKDLGGNRFETGTATRGALAEAGGRLARPVGRGRGPARGRGADRGGSGAVRGGLTGYGSTRTPVAISTGGHPCPGGRSGPMLGTQGEEPRTVVRRPLGTHRPAGPGPTTLPRPPRRAGLDRDRAPVPRSPPHRPARPRPDRAVRHRRRARAGGRGHRGHPPQRGGVVRPDPARPRPVRLARRDRRRDRRGAGRRDRRRPRRGRPPPARGPLAGGAAVADAAGRAHVTHVAAAVRARGPGRGRGPLRARRRGRPGPPPHRRPDRARSRWRPPARARWASRRTGWRSSARARAARAWAWTGAAARPPTPRCRRPAGAAAGTPSPPARAPTSGSPTGSRTGCAPPTGSPTSSRRRSASTAGSRARSSCPAGPASRGRRPRAGSSRPRRSRRPPRSPASTRCATRRPARRPTP